ncbi:AlpA family phage regulatory protein [Xenorhabdus bovienii]|uniref:helix-turn-helix transcriptional regulator n=1 Tax=Xenorhabdus bovienii TaxID=40576 RepID=UPI00237C9334|nr:AlpA family phage regulatory protein [Xenorhabdus bovienii]MDE1495716.1 AlpA family phage regulatory protein [Xenorhabdus bovienii]MDE9437995.1 AlpA family phage regulatory protein [Xenorhabdus bovienii]MDE9456071.1 AlpA family phage regulatory protein [Xenorhabdus bovienii]MDE9474026.1 AlpA family phage regulatory protein [Xenorhabdus bovienii]MDE9499342.1 AlpA family phage regulatory protein [Xenorhabdus bovienii]
MTVQAENLYTKDEVKALLRYRSNSGFHDFLKKTPNFPQSVKLGLRKVYYRKNEIDVWLVERLSL